MHLRLYLQSIYIYFAPMNNDKIKHDAKKMVDVFYYNMNPDAPDCNISYNQCKQCALLSIDFTVQKINNYDEADLCILTRDQARFDKEYFSQLKIEIENL